MKYVNEFIAAALAGHLFALQKWIRFLAGRFDLFTVIDWIDYVVAREKKKRKKEKRRGKKREESRESRRRRDGDRSIARRSSVTLDNVRRLFPSGPSRSSEPEVLRRRKFSAKFFGARTFSRLRAGDVINWRECINYIARRSASIVPIIIPRKIDRSITLAVARSRVTEIINVRKSWLTCAGR